MLAMVGGPPAVILSVWGLPSIGRVSRLWSVDVWQGSTENALVDVMALLCLAAWAWMMAAAVMESVALRRGRAVEDASPLRRGLRPLLAAVVLKSVLAGSAMTAAGASQAWANEPIEAVAVEEVEDAATGGALVAYRVVQHDTLWGIAERFLGDGMRWREVYEASRQGVQVHRGEMTDPNLIYPGDIVLLPGDSAPVEDAPGVEEIAAIYGDDVAALTRGAVALAAAEELSLRESEAQVEAAEAARAAQASEVEQARAAAEAEAARAAQASEVEQARAAAEAEAARAAQASEVEQARAAAEAEAARAAQAVAQAEVLEGVEGHGAPEGMPVVGHDVSMDDISKLGVASVSLLTLGGLGVTLLRRRRRGASERARGEVIAPLPEELVGLERVVLDKVEEVVPWAEWLASAAGDLMARRPLGAARVQFVEGSDNSVEALLTPRCEIDWNPWSSVHGSNLTVLSLGRDGGELGDDVDGWAALPLLITVGERLCLNFETAGVVSAVAAHEGTGGEEAMRGLCRAIVSEVGCRSAECDVDLWVTRRAAVHLGRCVEASSVRVMDAGRIDEEVAEVWRDVSSRRAHVLPQMQMSVDDDRQREAGIGSCLVICDPADTGTLAETLRLASEGRHNLAVLVMGASDTDTRLELSVPGGEMVVYPWGLRVSACYASAAAAAALSDAAKEPARRARREPMILPREPAEWLSEAGAGEVRPIGAGAEPLTPTLSKSQSRDRFGAASAAKMRQSRDSAEARTADGRVTPINLDRRVGSRAEINNVVLPETAIEATPPDDKALLQEAARSGAVVDDPLGSGGQMRGPSGEGLSLADEAAAVELTPVAADAGEATPVASGTVPSQDGEAEDRRVSRFEHLVRGHDEEAIGGTARADEVRAGGDAGKGDTEGRGTEKYVEAGGEAAEGAVLDAHGLDAKSGGEDAGPGREPSARAAAAERTWKTQRVLRRHKSRSRGRPRLSPHCVDALRECGPDLRWAVLTVGPIRVVSTAGGNAGEAIAALDPAASLAALITASGALSYEEAQTRLRFGANAMSWEMMLDCLRENFGDDLVDDPSALGFKGTVSDLAFFGGNFDAGDFEAGMEMLRGEVFECADGGAVVWRYDGLVEHARAVVADWCSLHGRRLLADGGIAEVQRVVQKGLASQPFDGALLDLDMECAFETRGESGAVARVAEFARIGSENEEFAQEALERVRQKRATVVKA